MIIGLTGSIACGKSTVSNYLRTKDFPIIDADIIARELVTKGCQGYEEIVKEFGDEILDEQNEIDRKKLGNIVFENEKKRNKLNHLLHPLIRKEMKCQTEKILKNNPNQIIIWDVPLLIESGCISEVEATIVVYTKELTQLKRLMERNQLSKEEALKRIRAVMSSEEKKKYADYLIDNSYSLSSTYEQIQQIIIELQKK